MKSSRKYQTPSAAFAFMLFAAGVALAAGPVAHNILREVSAAQAKAMWQHWKEKHSENSARNPAAPGEPVLWLRVPPCKISTLVLQESNAEALHRFPAVRQLESGGSVVFAHRDIHFRALAGIRAGDTITAETADGKRATYTVRLTRILLPEQISVALNDPECRDALHLLTCYPFHYMGAAPKRFLVTATKS
jgi:sortase A